MHTELSINRTSLPRKVCCNSLVLTTIQLLSNIPRSVTDNAFWVQMQGLPTGEATPPPHSKPQPLLGLSWQLRLYINLSQEGFAGWVTLPSLSPPASQNSLCFSTCHDAGFLLLGQEGQDTERIPQVCFTNQYFNYLKKLQWKDTHAGYNDLY